MTRRSNTSVRRLALCALPALLVVAACGGSDGDGDSLDTAAESTTTEVPADTTPVTEVVDTAAPDTEPADTTASTTPDSTTTTTTTTTGVAASGSSDDSDTDTDSGADPGGDVAPSTEAGPETVEPDEPLESGEAGDCLVGDWVITNAEMNAYYSALAANAGDGMVSFTVPTGQVFLTFTPDTYQYSSDFEIVVSVSGIDGTGTSTGTVSGTWEGSDGVVTTTLGESNLDVEITVAGQVIDLFGGGGSADGSGTVNSILESAPINDAPYSCAGPTPTIEFLAGGAGQRHTVTLTPA